MAEALFREKVRELKKSGESYCEIEVRSAGLYKFKGMPVSPYTLTVLAEYGIQYDHSPQRLNPELLAWASLVLTMTKFHKCIALAIYASIINKTFTLKEFVGDLHSLDISDPVGRSLFRYRQCAQEIDQALNLLQEKLADVLPETSFDSFPLPTPQSLPRTLSLLRWLMGLMELSKKTRN